MSAAHFAEMVNAYKISAANLNGRDHLEHLAIQKR
jgi:hypothetical protein